MDNSVPEDALAMIGVEKVCRYVVTKRDIKRFVQAIGETNPIYFDESCAKSTGYGVIHAPPLFCQIFAFEDVAPDRLPNDGSPIEMDVPIPAKRTVGGASSYEIFRRIKVGDQITAKSVLTDVFTKRGKSGQLYFVVVETEFSDQQNKPVAKEIATYIKRS
jgi:hydroxyacyl-ACP dehydratase HTD2-like protein with hotdog domain